MVAVTAGLLTGSVEGEMPSTLGWPALVKVSTHCDVHTQTISCPIILTCWYLEELQKVCAYVRRKKHLNSCLTVTNLRLLFFPMKLMSLLRENEHLYDVFHLNF